MANFMASYSEQTYAAMRIVAGLLFLPWFAYLLGNFSGIAKVRPEPFSTT